MERACSCVSVDMTSLEASPPPAATDSPRPAVLFFGGNGHARVRLDPAREALGPEPAFDLLDVEYPGFEGRERVPDLDRFLDGVVRSMGRHLAGGRVRLVHATGVGALVVLALRARGNLGGLPTVFLGPVLWGLEQRRFPHRDGWCGLMPCRVLPCLQ